MHFWVQIEHLMIEVDWPRRMLAGDIPPSSALPITRAPNQGAAQLVPNECAVLRLNIPSRGANLPFLRRELGAPPQPQARRDCRLVARCGNGLKRIGSLRCIGGILAHAPVRLKPELEKALGKTLESAAVFRNRQCASPLNAPASRRGEAPRSECSCFDQVKNDWSSSGLPGACIMPRATGKGSR